MAYQYSKIQKKFDAVPSQFEYKDKCNQPTCRALVEPGAKSICDLFEHVKRIDVPPSGIASRMRY
jgi:hypothetical protein